MRALLQGLAAAGLSFLLLGPQPAQAQTVSCEGVAAWQASTIYQPGNRLVYSGRLYEAVIPIWNAPPTHCPSCGWYRDLGACGSVGENQPPTVNLSAPGAGDSFAAGSAITLAANASDSDGSVASVEFFRGTVSLGVDSSAPYSVVWSNAAAGSYSLTAVAQDNRGARTTSAAVAVTVTPGTDTVPPSVPASLASPSQTTSSIALSWSASTDNAGGTGVVGYEVWRNGARVGQPTTTSFNDTGLTADTAYSYQVRARDGAGNLSALSAALSARTLRAAQCTAVPAVPSGLASPSQTSNSISLSWSAVSPPSNCSIQYRIYRGGTLLDTVATPNFTATGLSPDTAYSFTVAAVTAAGSSAQSGALSVRTRPQVVGGQRVTAYFVQWGIYARNYLVRNIATSGTAERITHINYAFGNVRNNRCEVGVNQPADGNTGAGGDAWADYGRSFNAAQSVDGVADTWDQPLRGSWNQLRKLKQRNPGLKVLISLGGWTWSRGFSDAARPENRVAFVRSCIDAYIRGNLPVVDGAGGVGAAAGVFDGIDIDWEYPVACGLACGRPEDRENFTGLLAEFRRQLDAIRPGLELTVAVGAGVDKIRVTDPGQYHQYLDAILVMTYDFNGAWEPKTNHHSALFRPAAEPNTGDRLLYNTDDALNAFLQRGVPANKLHIGIGFYGRGWTGVPNVNNGLYQNGRAATGTYEAGIEDYKVLQNLNWPSFRDSQAGAHWIFNGNTFWSFDDPQTVRDKMSYARQMGLGGAFFWELSGDDAQGSLSRAVHEGLRN
ncbi:glycosyl hydrolase family 18 protein [Aquimonas sp.]|jgi:chitinase|uniref:glycosyl hydrolase family 18 protein n=1 Tax=Aquimonas sp. TaxID=1872588 RepID=UPI0037C0BAE3